MSPFISILLIPSSRCLYIRSSFNMNSFFFFKEVTFNLKDICLMNFFCFDGRFREEEMFKTALFRDDNTENETKTEKN